MHMRSITIVVCRCRIAVLDSWRTPVTGTLGCPVVSEFSQFSPYANLPGDPTDWMYDPPVLSGPVGWLQPNYPEDVTLIQRIVNVAIDNGYLEAQAAVRIDEDGQWDEDLDAAIGAIEFRYLSGMASPFGQKIVDNGSPLFQFLVHLAAGNANLVTQYSPLLYQLAHVMLPGRLAARNLSLYLPNILQAMAFNGIADTEMVLVALASIRAETSGVAPVSEGVSRYNSSPAAMRHAPGTHTFDLYDARADIGNRGAPDGASFRGRGFVQLTGREHYADYEKFFQWPLVEKPDLANDPWAAAALLGKFIRDHEVRIRSALRRNDLRAARRAVNGGSHGLAEFILAMNAGRTFLQQQIAGHVAARLASLAGTR